MNIIFVIAPALAAWGGYLAAAELTGDLAASFAAGLIFGFSSYMLSQMQGHLNLVFILAVPLCAWACIAAAKHRWPGWHLAVILGLLLAFQVGVSQEIFASLCLFGVIAWVCLWCFHPALRPRLAALVPGMAAGLAFALVLSAPIIWQMLVHYADSTGGLTPAVNISNDLLAFVVPTLIDAIGGVQAWPLVQKFPGNISEQSAYIGLPLLVLLALIVRRRRGEPAIVALAVFIVLAAVLSLGPVVQVRGIYAIPAPWHLAINLPFVRSLLPARFMLYAWGAIALLIALWLASPGAKTWRYLALACCLIFLAPSTRFDRNWSRLPVPAVFLDGKIAPGSNILILPDFGMEMGYQYAAGMRFRLVGQGYLGTGLPEPFAQWPLFQPLFNSDFAHIDPVMLNAYLTAYGVQNVVVTQSFYRDYASSQKLDDRVTAAGAMRLLTASGWRVERTYPDATLFEPPAEATRPSTAQLAAYMRVPLPPLPAAHLQKLVKSETRRVCEIRAFARMARLNPEAILQFYAAHIHLALPPDAIRCPLRDHSDFP